MAKELIIEPVRSSRDLSDTAVLFRAYGASLDIELDYQDFATELVGLPGKYAPPDGALLLARECGGRAIGCVALRPLEAGFCEMKRLYVTPEGRGMGVGKALVERVILAARRIGYAEMWLDTLPTMAPAHRLYEQQGFERAAPYYDTPVAGTVFLKLQLHD